MAAQIEAKAHFYRDRTRIDRLKPEQADQFLTELEAFARERGFRIAKGGVTLTEKPGADELPTIDVLFVQWPRDL